MGFRFEFNIIYIINKYIKWLANFSGHGYIHQQDQKQHIFGLHFAIGFSQFKHFMIGIEILLKLVKKCKEYLFV